MGRDYWRGYRGGPARTAAVSSDDGVSQLTERWSVGLRDATVIGDALRTTPHGLLVGRTDGLSVLDTETGSQHWNYTKAAPIHGVEYAEGRVYLGTDDGVVAIDSQSGAEVDTIDADFPRASDRPDKIAVTDTTVIANTRSGITAYDATDGTVEWSAESQSAEEFAVGDERVYGRFGDELRAFVLDSGRQLWAVEHRAGSDAYRDVLGARPEGVIAGYRHAGTPAEHRGIALLSGDDGSALVSAEGGSPSVFHVTDKTVLVAHDGTLQRRTLADGTVEWERSLNVAGDGLSRDTSHARAGETFYLGTGRQVSAINAATGAEVARVQLTHALDAVTPTADQLFAAGGDTVTAYEDQVTKVFDK